MSSLTDLGSWGSKLVGQGSNLLGQASTQLAPAASAAAAFARSSAKAVKSSIKENFNGLTNETHIFEQKQGGVRSVVEVAHIAEGAFGAVTRVRDKESGREYAMKVINCQEGVQVASTVSAAVLEAKILQNLPQHPNIIQCFGSSVQQSGGNGVVKLLLELCTGGHLLGYMDSRGGKLSAKEIVTPLAQVTAAVRHMHSQRPPIQHRDLKVENVLQGQDGQWKLCDFGSCSTEAVPAQELSRERMLKLQEEIDKTVTMLYRPPEMADIELNIRKGFAITQQVDMWMIGCILYTLAFYRHPFQDNATAMAICNAKYFIPFEHPMANSSKLTGLIHWLLAADPNDRPTSDRLVEVLQNLSKATAEELVAGMPRAVQEKIKKFAAEQKKSHSAMQLDEITPEMAAALAAKAGGKAPQRGSARPTQTAAAPRERPAEDWCPDWTAASPTPATNPAGGGFDLAFALAPAGATSNGHVASLPPVTGQGPGSPASPTSPISPKTTPAPVEDLLGFGPPGADELSAKDRAKSAPAIAHHDLLGDGPSRKSHAVTDDLMGFGAPQAAPFVTPAAAPAAAGLVDWADFSAAPAQPAAPSTGPPVQGHAAVAGGDLLLGDFGGFGNFTAAPAATPPPKAGSATSTMPQPANVPAQAIGSVNLLDF